jgi:hypothetical protein
MKKLLSMILAAGMMLSISACGNDVTDVTTTTTTAETTTTTAPEMVDVWVITMHNGDVITGALDTVENNFSGIGFNSFTTLTATRDGNEVHIEKDNPDNPDNPIIIDYGWLDTEQSEFLTSTFTIETEDGQRIISMFNVSSIKREQRETIELFEYEPYERKSVSEGETVNFNPVGTATIHLKDGTEVITYPGALPQMKSDPGNFYLIDEEILPDYAVTRHFYLEEAETISFQQLTDDIFELTGKLSNGELVKKFITFPFEWRGDNAYIVYTTDGTLVRVLIKDIDRIDVDMSVTPVFPEEKTVRVTLTDGTVFNTPQASFQYTYNSPVFKDELSDSSIEIYGEGYSSVDVRFDEINRIEFTPELMNEDYNNPGKITYKDGTEEDVIFVDHNIIRFFCDYRYGYGIGNYYIGMLGPYKSISPVKSIEFDV